MKLDTIRLRDSAQKLLEAAQTPRNFEIIDHYKKINALRPAKPTVSIFMPESANRALFGERNTLSETFETEVRRFGEFKVDMPVSSVIYSGLIAETTQWSPDYHTVRVNPDGTSNAFKPCIIEYHDLKKLHAPELHVDIQKTRENYEKLYDELGDILDVRWGSPFFMTCGWGESMIDQFAELRGLENLYYDMKDAPEFVHEAMDYMTRAKLNLLEQYRQQCALICNWDGGNTIGSCSYPFTDELPIATGIDEHALWGFAQAQEFAGVSTEMLDEFVLKYQARIACKFGLLSYGCCEPMDKQIDILAERFNNLRILSVSPYSDIKIAASKCAGKFVMNCKLHPSLVAMFNENRVREALAKLIKAIDGCSATLSFAEIINYGDDPRVFTRLADITNEEIDKIWTGEYKNE